MAGRSAVVVDRVGPGDDLQAHRRAVRPTGRPPAGRARRDVHVPRRGGPGRRLAGARVVVAARCSASTCVGVADPGLVAALGVLGQAAERPDAGQGDAALPLPGRQVVHGDLADRVPASRRPAAAGASSSSPSSTAYAVEHRLGVLGQQVVPGVGRRAARVGDGEPAAGGARSVITYSRPSPAHVRRRPRVHALLDDGQRRRRQVAAAQVGEPEVVARRGARGALTTSQRPSVETDTRSSWSCPGPPRRPARRPRRPSRPGAARPAGGTAPRRAGTTAGGSRRT